MPKTKKKSRIRTSKRSSFEAMRRSRLAPVLIALAFGLAGFYLLSILNAATTVLAQVEAESLVLPNGAVVVSDSNASGSKAVKLTRNGTVTGSVTLPSNASVFTLKVRANQCNGSPKITIKVGSDTVVSSMSVTKSSYTNIDVPFTFMASAHQLSVTASNVEMSQKRNCNRNVFVDFIKFSGTAIVPPTPTTPPVATVGGPFLAYSENSFFRKPLPDAAPVDAKSSEGIEFLKTVPEQRGLQYPKINGLGDNKWGTVYVEGKCTDPIWKLTGTVPDKVAFLKTEGFHAPALLGNILTGTSDSPFVVMDTCGVPSMPRGLSVWASKSVIADNNTITVGSAGAFQHDSNGLDSRNPKSTSTKNFRSRGAIPDAMVIRKDRLDWAVTNNTDLGHVLHMFFVETRTTDGFVHPMIGTESEKMGWGPEGIRIRIKASVDLTKRGLSPGGLVVAKTLQRYGAYLGDNAGNESTLKAEQNYGQWGNQLNKDSLQGLIWDDFEFVQRGYEP